ncbi:MAG: bifunctional demethylmenaquinone methyltransferase/2-methoxy-6-polyprenyl-1,4-benzoquinol methylase UbiE [Flavobacteriia bacterium]|nr:bifunctional demethylmenaquinone methyltransferase/2-methoxy-6-polyprenyl-1,4-benzoquinol methylase UbiE [Flavobacteriia bacterium]NBV68109.1 bifunctional demethylmenaquinone methyltransferase/2-methoxy-6-polyprenyl-1,4-benzoquinol methylase UbiE [Flavobacteriia bacterium]
MSKPIVKPYNTERSKKEEVAEMFNSISSRYDFLNHFLSLGIDHIWRRKAIRELKSLQPKRILDLATGTGDFAIAALRLNPTKIVGMDISKGMLSMGEIKMKKRGFDQVIEMKLGDSEALPFENDSFDAITVGFGVRNFENLTLGLSEMLRVTRKDGKIIILEFSKPKNFPVKQAFHLYSKYFIPFFGKRISKDAKAYSYLPESVAAFPEGEEFKNILSQIGYRNVQSKLVSGGIATIYIAEK